MCPLLQGRCPEKRSNHSAVAVESSLYVFGGGNSVQQFKDLYILDTGTQRGNSIYGYRYVTFSHTLYITLSATLVHVRPLDSSLYYLYLL